MNAPRLLVLGDVMLDRYVWGRVERISPEAPVPVLRSDEEEVRPGGAASVANLARGLGAEVVLAGLVGDDGAGTVLRRVLRDGGVDDCLLVVDRDRRTTVKERIVGRGGSGPQQICRVDREDRVPIPPGKERSLVEPFAEEEFDAVLVSDYGKGVCTDSVLRAIVEVSRQRRVPVVVDPALGVDPVRYAGASVLTPNRREASEAGGFPVTDLDRAISAARSLVDRGGVEAAVVTLDREGLVVVDRDGSAQHVPVRARRIGDVTGAGDMVLAALGLGLARGDDLLAAAEFANRAAGVEVEHFGVASIGLEEIEPDSSTSKIVDRERLFAIGRQHRRAGRRIVFTNGCFDLLHVGHVRYLREARALGDLLVVGVNDDDGVRRLKGPGRPVVDERSRAEILVSLASVDHVVLFDEETPHALLEGLRPDVLVKGGDYAPDEVVGHEVVEAYGGEVRVLSLVPDVSTSGLLNHLKFDRGAKP